MANMKSQDPFIREVRAGLARNGRTQTDLAVALHLSRAAIARRMNGSVPFDHRDVKQISDFLGVPVAVLYGETTAAAA